MLELILPAGMLSCALTNARLSGPAPIYYLLDLLERIHKTKPKMLQIWSKSGLATQGRRDEQIENSLGSGFNMEQKLRDILAEGQPEDALVSFN